MRTLTPRTIEPKASVLLIVVAFASALAGDVSGSGQRDPTDREALDIPDHTSVTSVARCHMKFILVNGRTPCRNSACALCAESIGNSYLREMGTQLYYCDQVCYADHCKRVMDLSNHTRESLVALAPKRAKNTSEAELMLTT
jgi:hypothetical protein